MAVTVFLDKKLNIRWFQKYFSYKKQQFAQSPESIQKYISEYMAGNLRGNTFKKSYKYEPININIV